MSIWNDIVNGEIGLSVRSKINDFNQIVEGRLYANESSIVDNETNIDSLKNSLRYKTNTGVTLDGIINEGIYIVDNTVPTSTPDNVSDNLRLEVVGLQSNTNGLIHHLSDLDSGKRFTRATNNKTANPIIWSIWIISANNANASDGIEFKDMADDKPLYKEGLMSYINGTIEVYGKSSVAPLRVGRMMQTDVYNGSGSIIPALTPVIYSGLYNGSAMVVPALADDFNTANVFGVTTSDIADGSSDIIVTAGLIKNVNTSSLTVGAPAYLSDTTSGEMVMTPPNIATQIGTSLKQDSAVGEFYVSIRNTINLPTIIGMMKGQNAEEYTLDAGVPTTVTNFLTTNNVVIETNITNGTMLIPLSGMYNLSFIFSGWLTDEEIDMSVDLYDIGSDLVLENFDFTSGRASSATHVPMSKTFNMPVNIPVNNTTISIRFTSATDEILTLNQASFSMTSLHLI